MLWRGRIAPPAQWPCLASSGLLPFQFHLLMTGNATKALVLYTGNAAVNLALVSTLYMLSAYKAFQASVLLQVGRSSRAFIAPDRAPTCERLWLRHALCACARERNACLLMRVRRCRSRAGWCRMDSPAD